MLNSICYKKKCLFYLIFIKSATSGAEKIIGDSLRANPGNSFSTLVEAKQKLVTGSYALIFVINLPTLVVYVKSLRN